jgi:hypothetical protein
MIKGATIYFLSTDYEYGDSIAIQEPDGSLWLSAKCYLESKANYVLKGLGVDLGHITDKAVEQILSEVPSRFKAKKIFLTEEGFEESLGITFEGLNYFEELNELDGVDEPDFKLVKKERS